MIAHHRLHDGQAQSGAVLLGRVVRREQPFAFFFASVPGRSRKLRSARRPHCRACDTRSVPPSGMASMAFSTRLPKRAAELLADRPESEAAVDRRFQSRARSSPAVAANCASNSFITPRTSSLTSTGLELRRRHLGEIAEPADDGLQVAPVPPAASPCFRGTLRRTASGCSRRARCRFSMVICSGKQRILQLVRQPARQFAPGRDALGLNGAVALLDQLLGHLVEGAGQIADLIAECTSHPRAPISAGDRLRRRRPTLHRPRDARRGPQPISSAPSRMPVPPTPYRSTGWSVPALLARAENCPPAARRARSRVRQRQGVDGFGAGRVGGPLDRRRDLALRTPHGVEQSRQFLRSPHGPEASITSPLGSHNMARTPGATAQRIQERRVQFAARPDNEDALFARTDRVHRRECNGAAGLQRNARQEGLRVARIFGRYQPIARVAESRRSGGRRDDGQIGLQDIEIVERLRVCLRAASSTNMEKSGCGLFASTAIGINASDAAARCTLSSTSLYCACTSRWN